MSAIQFPSNPTLGQQYSAPNGVVYTWDGIKWLGAVIGNTINSIGYGTYTIYINTGGNLVIPNGSSIVQQSGAFTESVYVNKLSLKSIVAASTSFTDFQTRILSL